MLKEQTKAPNFSLPDQNGVMHSLADSSGKWLLVYFYPKDDTPGCTKEACGLRDSIDEYRKRGVEVFGISTDSVESHKKFEEKYGLPFTLLSDPKREAVDAYEAGAVGARRISYLIGPDGTIRKAYPKVDPAVHALQIIKDLDVLMK